MNWELLQLFAQRYVHSPSWTEQTAKSQAPETKPDFAWMRQIPRSPQRTDRGRRRESVLRAKICLLGPLGFSDPHGGLLTCTVTCKFLLELILNYSLCRWSKGSSCAIHPFLISVLSRSDGLIICSESSIWCTACFRSHASQEWTLWKHFFQQEYSPADLWKCAIGHKGGWAKGVWMQRYKRISTSTKIKIAHSLTTASVMFRIHKALSS